MVKRMVAITLVCTLFNGCAIHAQFVDNHKGCAGMPVEDIPNPPTITTKEPIEKQLTDYIKVLRAYVVRIRQAAECN